MKQILQSLTSKDTTIENIPVPEIEKTSIIIASRLSLISTGTERMLVDFAGSNWIKKAKKQPEKVAQVIQKLKTDGLTPTIQSVKNKIDIPMPMGYCNVGTIVKVGEDCKDFSAGDRVASSGSHAEVVRVSRNLCAKVPDNVSDEEASFTVISAIALQGIRLAKPLLGETFVVIGLGLIGLITVQLLKANGCVVIGIDFDDTKLKLAEKYGAKTVNLSSGQDPIEAANLYTNGHGVDGVLITASTTSNEPMHQAAEMLRKRGRIILVGVTGLKLDRSDFFKKEISFQVSSSYGPGRYDPLYEEKGIDYPIGFVRWTEQRNFEAVLQMMSEKKLDINDLISSRFDIEDAQQAYRSLLENKESLGILLRYKGYKFTKKSQTVSLYKRTEKNKKNTGSINGTVSFIGAGNYATVVLIPAFMKSGAKFKKIISDSGLSGVHAGKKYKFEEASTDSTSVFKDKDTHSVIITTRHDSHAQYVIEGMKYKKNIFVEKPLCISSNELNEIQSNYDGSSILMVGYNRRFSPLVKKVKELLASISSPKSFIYTINSGYIPKDHWIHDADIGGGRIIGEVCHFIDLLRFLSGHTIESYSCSKMLSDSNDTVSIHLNFSDGSIGTINYFSNGSKFFPKERVEVFCEGKVLQLDNFKKLKGYGWTKFKNMSLWTQDKGQSGCAKAFLTATSDRSESPIPYSEIIEVAKVSIEIAELVNNA